MIFIDWINMKYERYEAVLVSKDALEYKFNSIGPKGEISIEVQFIETGIDNVYNLAFGNLLPDGNIDDHIKNNNNDRDKILATVAEAVYKFSDRYPGKLIYFKGSTPERTRLYRMALTINLTELSLDFHIYGMVQKTTGLFIEAFTKGKEYDAFVIQRKNY
jgi:hypothetical protein